MLLASLTRATLTQRTRIWIINHEKVTEPRTGAIHTGTVTDFRSVTPRKGGTRVSKSSFSQHLEDVCETPLGRWLNGSCMLHQVDPSRSLVPTGRQRNDQSGSFSRHRC